MVADPKALQYIFHTSGYHFVKTAETLKTTELLLGRGIVWAHGLQFPKGVTSFYPLKELLRRSTPTSANNYEPGILRAPAENISFALPKFSA